MEYTNELILQCSSSNSSSSCSTPSSLSPCWSFLPHTSTPEPEFESIPAVIEKLDKMCYQPELAQHQRQMLLNPHTVNNILLSSEPNARTKLIVYFQWLEKSTKDFVWAFAQNINYFVTFHPHLCADLLLGFPHMLNLATFLTEGKWYSEAIILLTLARSQAKSDPVEVLQVLKVQVVAESLSKRHEAALLTMSEIGSIMAKVDIPLSLTAELRWARSINHFENCEFEASFHQALLALYSASEETCSYETIIATFRQLGRACIAVGKLIQARLLTTQAMSWAWCKFGPNSVVYAEALEDYAFYLLMMDAYDDAVKVADKAKQIYFNLYGHLGVEAEFSQGNLAFQLYLESYGYQELAALDQYAEYIVDMAHHRQKKEQPVSDDRQILAFTRMRPLLAMGDICGVAKGNKPRDLIDHLRPPLALENLKDVLFSKYV